MKKYFVYFFFTVVGLLMLSGCSNIVDQSSSSVLRTVGLGEEALPIGRANLGMEASFQKVRMLDKIIVTEYSTSDNPNQTDVSVSGSNSSGSDMITDFRIRLGLTELDELSFGLMTGSEGGTNTYSSTYNGTTTTKEFECVTKYTGFKVGYKRLLSSSEKPLKISMFMSFAGISFDSKGDASKYDAKSFETKAAILFGVNEDLNKRHSYPTLALYHSSAHTTRDETIEGIAKEKNSQNLGAEMLFMFDFGYLYSSLSAGVEKQLSDTVEYDDLQYHMGFKLGLKFAKRKQ